MFSRLHLFLTNQCFFLTENECHKETIYGKASGVFQVCVLLQTNHQKREEDALKLPVASSESKVPKKSLRQAAEDKVFEVGRGKIEDRYKEFGVKCKGQMVSSSLWLYYCLVLEFII